MQDKLSRQELQDFLDSKFRQYNTPAFIANDPIQIPHRFGRKEDIEISAFLSSAIAWGKREMIIRSASRMMNLIRNTPYQFIMQAKEADLSICANFVHRTFQAVDFVYFLKALQNIYCRHGGLSQVFKDGFQKQREIKSALIHFREIFFELEHPQRSRKHISDVRKNSAAKRLNMFLMWMVRQDSSGVHFGLWDFIPKSELIIPLDVHCGRTARELGLLKRKQNDFKAALELTSELKKFCPEDPVKYDFALFGTGVFEGFGKKQ